MPVRSGGKGEELAHSAQLLREADTNGAVFLALPANGPERNSINDDGSLLRTICQNSDATHCRGRAAGEAEFRTSGQTWSRMGGLLLIVVGALGMVLLLGFIALRLLSAALFSLFYLLVAPGMVLAPALGEGGRAIFRRWAGQLLSAVVSKLLFSFLLGVVLAVLGILASLRALGWWTQWLLMSAFWWGAYLRRHQALGVAQGAFAGHPHLAGRREPRSVARRASDVLETRKAMAALRWARERRARPAAEGDRPRPSQRNVPAPAIGGPRAGRRATVARRSSEGSDEAARQRLAEQLERVRSERTRAQRSGDRRRALKLGARAGRIEMELQPGAGPGRAGSSSHPGAGAERSSARERVSPPSPEQHRRGRGGPAKGPPDPDARRRARLPIDRDLALLRERLKAEGRMPQSTDPSESVVMRDAREVEAGRKRFLGPDLP